MTPTPTLPSPSIVSEFARLVQGAPPQTSRFDSWPEPWKSLAVKVAASDAPRKVLQEGLSAQLGEAAEAITRSIFDGRIESAPGHWEPPVNFDEQQTLPPFPVEALPPWLRDFVGAEAEATQTPLDLPALMSLSVLSLALAKKLTVAVQDGWSEPVNLWTMTAMEPANRKSAVVRDVMEPVVIYQREELGQVTPLIREARARRKIVEGRCEFIRAQASKASGLESEHLTAEAVRLAEEAESIHIPPTPKLWTDDCTPEMMGSLLAEHGGRMAIISAEGNVFELMAGRYSKGRPNLGIYLAGHAGDAYVVDRRGRPSEQVEDAAITVGITVQPEIMRSLGERPGFRGSGLLARFLYSVPESRLGSRRIEPEPMPARLATGYQQHILQLLRLRFRTDEDGARNAHVIRLQAEARLALRQFQRELEPQLAPYGELGPISDWAGKLCGTIVRLAGLLHAAEHALHAAPWELPIALHTMQSAIRIGEYFIPHARAAFGEMGHDSQFHAARHILGWLKRKGMNQLKERDLQQAMRGNNHLKRMDNLRSALALLVDHGWLRLASQERTGVGRKPSALYEVNPHLHASS